MGQGIQGLKIALLALVCAGGVIRAQAQEPPLEKKVKADYEHEQLDAVLKDLAKQGKIQFAYKSNIVRKERLVTLKIPESTLQEVLVTILGDGFDVVGEDDYVIIRPRAAASRRTTKAAISRKTLAERGVYDNIGPGKKPMYFNDSVLAARKEAVRGIIDQMVADGLVRDKNSFSWFALDNGQFVLDGKPMTDSLRVKYAAKFIAPEGDGLYYGPVSVHGKGFFFGKKDIYGSPD
jgi:hypothetical protein